MQRLLDSGQKCVAKLAPVLRESAKLKRYCLPNAGGNETGRSKTGSGVVRARQQAFCAISRSQLPLDETRRTGRIPCCPTLIEWTEQAMVCQVHWHEAQQPICRKPNSQNADSICKPILKYARSRFVTLYTTAASLQTSCAIYHIVQQTRCEDPSQVEGIF